MKELLRLKEGNLEVIECCRQNLYRGQGRDQELDQNRAERILFK